jgi:hypothetical protein
MPEPEATGPSVHRTERRLAVLLTTLATIVLITVATTWGTLALALRSLESAWHDRVEALEFLYGSVTPLERTVASIAAPRQTELIKIAERVDSATVQSRESWRRYLTTTFTEDERRLVDDIKPTFERVYSSSDSLVTLLQLQDTARAAPMSREYLHAVAALSGGIEPLVRLQARVTRQMVQSARQRQLVARSMLLVSAVATVGLVFAALRGSRRRRFRG